MTEVPEEAKVWLFENMPTCCAFLDLFCKEGGIAPFAPPSYTLANLAIQGTCIIHINDCNVI